MLTGEKESTLTKHCPRSPYFYHKSQFYFLVFLPFLEGFELLDSAVAIELT
jgi:hypothetical protein